MSRQQLQQPIPPPISQPVTAAAAAHSLEVFPYMKTRIGRLSSIDEKQRAVQEVITEHYHQTRTLVVTDASLNKDRNCATGAMYIRYPSTQGPLVQTMSVGQTVPAGQQIDPVDAESSALYWALRMLLDEDRWTATTVVLTDSQYTLKDIQDRSLWEDPTRAQLATAVDGVQRHTRLILQWVPAHCGFKIHDMVDEWAQHYNKKLRECSVTSLAAKKPDALKNYINQGHDLLKLHKDAALEAANAFRTLRQSDIGLEVLDGSAKCSTPLRRSQLQQTAAQPSLVPLQQKSTSVSSRPLTLAQGASVVYTALPVGQPRAGPSLPCVLPGSASRPTMVPVSVTSSLDQLSAFSGTRPQAASTRSPPRKVPAQGQQQQLQRIKPACPQAFRTVVATRPRNQNMSYVQQQQSTPKRPRSVSSEESLVPTQRQESPPPRHTPKRKAKKRR